jgi:hypothetical protein
VYQLTGDGTSIIVPFKVYSKKIVDSWLNDKGQSGLAAASQLTPMKMKTETAVWINLRSTGTAPYHITDSDRSLKPISLLYHDTLADDLCSV